MENAVKQCVLKNKYRQIVPGSVSHLSKELIITKCMALHDSPRNTAEH